MVHKAWQKGFCCERAAFHDTFQNETRFSIGVLDVIILLIAIAVGLLRN